MEILYLVVGRGGSKGVPGKNLREIDGLSLGGHKTIAARKAETQGRIIVSSDDPAIQREAARWGAEVPFTRSAELASDAATTADVVLHAMDHCEHTEGRRYDAVMLLEPSSPFARPQDLDAAAALFKARAASLVVGVCEAHVAPVFFTPMAADGGFGAFGRNVEQLRGLRRQDQPPTYTVSGAWYLIGWDAMRRSGQIYRDADGTYGLALDRAYSHEIDAEFDLVVARALEQIASILTRESALSYCNLEQIQSKPIPF